MYQGDWSCSDCGAKIAELPFEPSPDRPIYCKDCHAKRRTQFRQ
ncbi:MAG: DNA-directed RNA polymerase [Candidatus Parcubacteria bacterium]|nr:DNA-directed RNA polymerase [Candidatus Parcubacteria bacterium]